MIDPSHLDQALALIPAGRIGQPEEGRLRWSLFCVATEAAYINAQMIGIDGGMAPGH